MTDLPSQTDSTPDDAPLDSLADPGSLRGRESVRFAEERQAHDDRNHCSAGVAGKVAVGVSNDDGEYLLLVHDELSVALLPHGTVDVGEDWASVARREAEGQTGVEIELDGIEAVRAIEHVVEGEDEPHASTHRVVFRGSPAGGEIQDCKRDAEAGGDGWRAGWFDGLPESVNAPDGGPGDDLRLFVE